MPKPTLPQKGGSFVRDPKSGALKPAHAAEPKAPADKGKKKEAE